MKDLERAIDEVGGKSKLARAVGVTKQAISKWVRQRSIPVERVISVSRATGWQVTPHQLRPDIYPNATDGLPSDDSQDNTRPRQVAESSPNEE